MRGALRERAQREKDGDSEGGRTRGETWDWCRFSGPGIGARVEGSEFMVWSLEVQV